MIPMPTIPTAFTTGWVVNHNILAPEPDSQPVWFAFLSEICLITGIDVMKGLIC